MIICGQAILGILDSPNKCPESTCNVDETVEAGYKDTIRRIPHFAYVEEIDMTELEDLRAHLN